MSLPRQRRALSAPSLDIVLVLAAVTLGALVRLIPVLSTEFPLNDGGLFAAMIDDLVRRGPLPPETVSYNDGNLPFAYPPLGLYLGSGLAAVGISTLDILRFVPVILSIASIPAWFLVARELVSPRLAATAALVFALLPRSYEWLIAGGGITRALGLLLVLLALRQSVRYLSRGRRFEAVTGGLLLGLTALSHLEAAAFGVATIILVAVTARRELRRVAVLGAISAASAGPWLVHVAMAHGVETLVSAGGSRIYRYLPVLQWMLGLRFTQEAYVALGAILGAVGQFLAVTSGRAWIPIWCLLIVLVIPGGAATYLMLPWSLGAALAVSTLVIPRLSPALRPAVLGSGLAVMLLASAWSPHGQSTHLRSVSEEIRSAMAWMASNFEPDTRTLVVTGIPWAGDAVSEWFPYLTGLDSVGTAQGHEFTPGWPERRRSAVELENCPEHPSTCIFGLIPNEWPEAQVIFVPKGALPGDRSSDCCGALRDLMRSQLVVLYDGPGATVLAARRDDR